MQHSQGNGHSGVRINSISLACFSDQLVDAKNKSWLQSQRNILKVIKLTIVAILNLYGLTYELFIGVIPWIYNTEIHPARFKGINSLLASISSFLIDWTVCRTLPIETKNLPSILLLVYGLLSLFGFF